MQRIIEAAVNIVLNDSDEDEEVRRPRYIRERVPHFDDLDDRDFMIRFRFSKEMALDVLSKIDHQLEFPSDKNASVAPINQLLLCLRYYATGCTQLAAGDFSGVSVSTANRIVHRVSRSIAMMCRDTIYMPRNENEIRMTQMEFYRIARFPKVIGAIDCTHVRILSPGGDIAELYRNRKGYFSLNVQAIVNKNLEFLNLVARWPGSANDITIFDQSVVRTQLELEQFGDSLLVADSGYSNRKYMMLPLSNPTTREEICYNESQIRTRNPVERVYGVWKRRFPVLALGVRTKVEKAMSIIVATGVLFNILRRRGEPEVPDDVNLRLPNDMPWENLIEFGQIRAQGDPAARINGRMIDPHRQALIHNFFRTLNEVYQ